ncbi:MAG: ribosome small subunit-dependent GTPase A, partial [Deltaproteobacteria bacterium]|nr:ribosome small subunit-dependent GTPase A [Deltaproteobacteria bacterium]
RGAVELIDAGGLLWGDLDARFRKADPLDRPAVGDWVGHRPISTQPGRTVVEALVPRRTAFVRRAAGLEARPQVVAANVDVVFVVTSIDTDFNPRRLERYLTVVREAGVTPVIVLSKVDRLTSRDEAIAAARAVGSGARILALSNETGEGISELLELLGQGVTGALVGSSGVGKSTLVNRILGDELLATAETRRDDRGRHTTTRRELILLPSGGLLMDTPGMREIGLWESDSGLAETFDEVDQLASNCRFRDCRHRDEPGCAVLAALESGELSRERYLSHQKLSAEILATERRRDPVTAAEDKQKLKALHRSFKSRPKRR